MGLVQYASMTSSTTIAVNKTVKLGVILPKSIIQKIEQKFVWVY